MLVDFAARIGALEIECDDVAVDDTAAFHGFKAGGAVAQPLQRLIDGVVVDAIRGAIERQRFIGADVECRNCIERRGERHRLAFLNQHVEDIGRIDRFYTPLAQSFVHRPRDKVVGDVVEDLVFEPLLDDARRRLAGAESRNPRLARVVARHAIDFGVDHVARDFNLQVFACFVDVDEVGFHWALGSRLWLSARTASSAAFRLYQKPKV